MKKFLVFLLILTCFNFVFAAESEISMGFAVSTPDTSVDSYVPKGSCFGYFWCGILIVFILVVLYFIFRKILRNKKAVKKKVAGKRIKKVATRKKVMKKRK